MFVGKQSLFAVSVYLDGYTNALIDGGHADPLYGWHMWIYHRFQIWHPAWHWTRVMLHIYGTDRDALAALPYLYSEFAALRASLDPDALGWELRNQLNDKYGHDWYEPEVTHTAAFG